MVLWLPVLIISNQSWYYITFFMHWLIHSNVLRGFRIDNRRGSCSGTGTNRATVAMVTDDPEHKSAMKEQLANTFGGEECKSPCFVY